ncbi:MAG TPA: M28 family peptidase, partial [Planctomycetes bacterium]|nr:M28 family peptidase [Planctomycetota bacterium]
ALALLAAPQGSDLPVDPLPPVSNPEITAEELRYHVAYLASDELRGREAGTPDAVRAARYLARVLEEEGLDPAGDGGTYLQRVPLSRTRHLAAPELMVTLEDGSVHRVANGIEARVSQRGEPSPTEELAVLRVAAPEDLPDAADPHVALFLDASRKEGREWLEAKGLDAESGWGLVLETSPGKRGRREVTPRGGALRPVREGPDPCDRVRLKGEARDWLTSGRVESVKLVYHLLVERVDDYNVLGRIDGVGTAEHPELAREVIVFSAHYDHLGVRETKEPGEDGIYNGADDDASGTAAVLEVAQALAAGDAPARTLIFLLAAGEEKGLLGTNYYIEHPVAPLDRTVCNLNFEMLGRPDPLAGGPGKMWLTGFERSNLGPAFQDLGLSVIQDPRPDQNFFQRSDNYAFAVRGIVAQTLSSYNLHEDYHHVSDETEAIDFEHMRAALVGAMAGIRALVSGEIRPEWAPGGRPGGR